MKAKLPSIISFASIEIFIPRPGIARKFIPFGMDIFFSIPFSIIAAPKECSEYCSADTARDNR
jgi:hypothetical protein